MSSDLGKAEEWEGKGSAFERERGFLGCLDFHKVPVFAFKQEETCPGQAAACSDGRHCEAEKQQASGYRHRKTCEGKVEDELTIGLGLLFPHFCTLWV